MFLLGGGIYMFNEFGIGPISLLIYSLCIALLSLFEHENIVQYDSAGTLLVMSSHSFL